MVDLFLNKDSFNADIRGWNVSKVTNMAAMFFSASAFNRAIGSWDVSKVTEMGTMFYDATAFNKAIGSWDVSRVTDMGLMFQYATAFNQPIGSWDVSRVTDMKYMFAYATSFNNTFVDWWSANKPNPNKAIGSWDVSRVTNMDSMFAYATDFSQNLSTWCVENVIYYDYFAYGTTGVTQPTWGAACCTVGDTAADSTINCQNNGVATGTANQCACDCTGTLYSGPTCTQCTAGSPDPCFAYTSTSLKAAVDLYTDEETKDEAIFTYGLIGTW
jgi:surface protein